MADKTELFQKLLQIGIDNKPNSLVISDLKWKYLVRCILRSDNILLIGPTGCAKTMAARMVSEIYFEVKEEDLTSEEYLKLKHDPSVEILNVDGKIKSP